METALLASMRQLLYDIALTCAAPAGAVWLAVQRRNRPLLARFSPRVPLVGTSPIWLHACSVGEVNVAKRLIPAIKEAMPETAILLTCSTVTGMALARESFADTPIAWFPFDHAIAVRRFYSAARPRMLVLIETELWPNVIREAHRRRVPVVMVNARISDKHFRRYRRAPRLFRDTLSRVAAAGAQNAAYTERLVSLGLPLEAAHVTGNVKFDGTTMEVPSEVRDGLRAACGIAATDQVLVFGSTRPGDEALAATCWEALRGEFPALKLVIAPRHAKRIEEALSPFNEPILRRSRAKEGATPGGERIIAVDTLGELVAFYSLADVAVVGGSFYPGVNGHNPLEPAALGVATVFGPYMSNFPDPARVLAECGGAVQVQAPEELPGTLRDLLQSPERRRAMGERSREAIVANQGAVARTVGLLSEVLLKSTRPA
ncbi:MAG: 3-deoxy-D-manno-octulosonic acid transferase [Candidatus Hydrogenedentes bacterium]|nr:3-deoxy-D-manno-octulosonic acid transferase [Candidatus Hydrogenedentota bacterium]